MIAAILADYDKRVAGQNAATDYEVTDRLEVGDGAELVFILYGNKAQDQQEDMTVAVVYDTNEVFCLDDWTLCPTDFNAIADYDWVHAQTGNRAVIIDGLPRVL